LTQRTGIGERLARGDPAMLSQLFDVLADAVTVRDLTGELVFANRAALARLGCESLQDLRSRSTAAMMEEYLTEDERGNPIGHGDIPSVRLIRGEPVSPLLLRTVNHSTGAVSWSLLKASPLREADGTLAGAITVIQDMTAVKAAEVQMRVLAESGRILASSLDYQQTLLNVTRVAVPALADFCGVDLLDEAGQLIRVAATQSAAANQDPAEQLRDLRPTQLGGDHPITGVLQTSTSVLYPQITDQELS
jgi:PAS domain S-box-containing protein